MSLDFYTNVTLRGNNILLCGYHNGQRITQQIPYKPYLFVPSSKPSNYKSLYGGANLERIDFNSISDAREFKETYSNVENFAIHGLGDFVYNYISDSYHGLVNYDTSIIKTVILDIEVEIGKGFPRPDLATQRITLIGVRVGMVRHIFGTGSYASIDDRIIFHKCSDERSLLGAFLEFWNHPDNRPDIVTGWNIEGFDIPYLVNRISQVLSPQDARRLSPWNWLKENTFEMYGKTVKGFIPAGVTILDYLQLYRKFTYTGQESYTLDHIAFIETGKRKIDYSEYSSLNELHEKNYTKYVDYNIGDLDRVYDIDQKMRLIDLVCAIAYNAKVNLIDAMTSVKLWDVIIYNYLREQNIIVPPFTRMPDHDIPGGFVKEPEPGAYNWVLSFDLTSLYPMLIQQYNISPEMFYDKTAPIIEDVIAETYEKPAINDKLGLTHTANGCRFRNESAGFLAALMAKQFAARDAAKKEMIERKKELQLDPSNSKLSNEISRLNNIQMALKINLNSAYGAIANKYFRYFNPDHAAAITLSGQMSVRWIEKKFNERLNKILKTKNVDYVIGIDTDSNYISCDALIKAVGLENAPKEKVVAYLDDVAANVLQPFIDKQYLALAKTLNAKNHMFMKRECIADKGIWMGKKRYALNVYNEEGVAYTEPKIKIVGSEAVRSSTPRPCRDAIKQSFKIFMNDTESDLIAFINKFRAEFNQMPFEDIAFPRGVSEVERFKDNNTLYKKGTPQHCKAAIVFNDFIKRKGFDKEFEPISDGAKIKFCYMSEPNPIRSPVFAVTKYLPDSFGLNKYIDYQMQFEKSYLSVIRNIADIVNWKIDRQSSLEDLI